MPCERTMEYFFLKDDCFSGMTWRTGMLLQGRDKDMPSRAVRLDSLIHTPEFWRRATFIRFQRQEWTSQTREKPNSTTRKKLVWHLKQYSPECSTIAAAGLVVVDGWCRRTLWDSRISVCVEEAVRLNVETRKKSRSRPESWSPNWTWRRSQLFLGLLGADRFHRCTQHSESTREGHRENSNRWNNR